MEEEPVETTNIPVKKPRGKPQTQEHMAKISKIGAETMKKIGTIRAYEKAQKKKEIEDKYAMIQNELTKQEEVKQEEEIKTTTKPKPKKTKKVIVEEVEEESEDEDEEEEEVIIKKVIKKKPSTRKVLDDYEEENIPNLIQKSSIEMLRRKYDDNMKERLRQSLFDC